MVNCLTLNYVGVKMTKAIYFYSLSIINPKTNMYVQSAINTDANLFAIFFP